ncbi:glycosyltransferase family 2 protein [Candidatus Paracaedibacter symbiosus]|uniref:glycosyltransferase family 2 protein n=1 Tax=Candidatus Paracaedibacter symbiosus TaxID=244582 RepID=UPI000509C849|nr:glycosyltransferase family 2 protein [Candidatus Paracaedibacter symbiosus]
MSFNKTLSVILITKNESQNIQKCLESVCFAAEIIVLDSGSQDNTVELCRKYTPHVFVTDWPGFGVQKNRALDKATSDWVLSIDADEVVSPALIQKIQEVINNPQAKDAYKIKRITQFCGEYLYYGDWKSDYPLRLFKRNKARFKEIPVHESLIVDGEIGKIQDVIWHNSFTSLEGVIAKMNAYSTLSALHMKNHGKSASLFKAIFRSLWTFLRGYIFKFGFLDGSRGFLLSIINAESCFYKYIKLNFLKNK